MFDIAWSELLLIAVVALIFIGPKELPQVLHNLGRAAAKLRRSADEFRRHFEESMRESGYEDLHKNIQDLRSLNPSSQIKETIDRAVAQDYARDHAAQAMPSPEPAVQELPDQHRSDHAEAPLEPPAEIEGAWEQETASTETKGIASDEGAAQGGPDVPDDAANAPEPGARLEANKPPDAAVRERAAPVA